MDTQRNSGGKTPVFALAYCHRDADAARRWLAWAGFLACEAGPAVRHDLVVMRSQRMAEPLLPALVPGVRVVQTVCRDEDERGYPGSATHLFIRTLEFCNARFPGRPVMFMEPDTVPLKPGWMDAIALEHDQCGGSFMGFHVDTSTCPHMAGCGVYPANWRKLSPLLAGILDAPRDSALFGKDKGQAWDIYAASEIEPQMARSQTIQQIWRPGLWIGARALGRLSPRAALFHQDKEGSLIRLLNHERFGGRFDWGFAGGDAAFFMLESPTERLIVNGELFVAFRKVARGPSGLVSIHQSIDPAEAEILRSMRGRHGLTQIDEAEYRALEKQAPRLR